MALAQNYFQNAHHFELVDSQFFSINNGNGMVINHGHNNDLVSTILSRHVATGAMFDSAERFPAGKCHPGTRKIIIQRIEEWMDAPDPTQRILWLYGPAGSGKSAIAQSICEHLRQSRSDSYGGSFFFAKGSTDRGSSLKLFASLSYQLAVQFPSMRREVNEALRRDACLASKSMEVQISSLIIQPLLQCRSFLSHIPTLIIDGLDECADDQIMDTQRTIIALISQSLVEHAIPLRFMIASRPEFWIRDTFETSPLTSITLPLSLRDDKDADTDIKAYLIHGFEKIRVENNRIMGSVKPPWPQEDVIDHFVYEASGQYIYAETVLKFVGKSSRFINPREQLRILTEHGPHRALAFSELDRLYEAILSTYPRWETMKAVLGGILCGADLAVISIILGVGHTELTLVLDALSPLIHIDRPKALTEPELLLEPVFGPLIPGQENVGLCHLSFREFLQDRTRSGQFNVTIHDAWYTITRCFFGIIHRNLEEHYAAAPHVELNIGSSTYHRMMYNMSCQCSEMTSSNVHIVLRFIIDTTHRILLLEPNRMNHPGFFKEEMELIAVALSSDSLGSSSPPAEVANSFSDTLTRFKDAASRSWQKIVQHLSLGKNFRVTPTLVYLSEFGTARSVPVVELFSVPWHTIADVLAALYLHQDVVAFLFDYKDQEWCLETQALGEVLDLEGCALPSELDWEEGWRTRGQWRQQRIVLAYQYINQILNYGYVERSPYLFVASFLIEPMSDIDCRTYFEDPYNLAILGLMCNLSTWTRVSPLTPGGWVEVRCFIGGVLRWFNRQLTNPDTLRLLNNRDMSLAMIMGRAMSQIFTDKFLPNFKGLYYSGLYVSTKDSETNPRSVRIQVLPMTQNHYQEEEIPYLPHEDLCTILWRPFHEEVFESARDSQDIPLSTIERIMWYHCLSSRLLNAIAKLLYLKTKPDFEVKGPQDDIEELFFYALRCLPHAETTWQNLDCFRAIAYFLPQVSCVAQKAPLEFWDLSVEFLRKYDRSILSKEELNIFECWLMECSST